MAQGDNSSNGRPHHSPTFTLSWFSPSIHLLYHTLSRFSNREGCTNLCLTTRSVICSLTIYLPLKGWSSGMQEALGLLSSADWVGRLLDPKDYCLELSAFLKLHQTLLVGRMVPALVPASACSPACSIVACSRVGAAEIKLSSLGPIWSKEINCLQFLASRHYPHGRIAHTWARTVSGVHGNYI